MNKIVIIDYLLTAIIIFKNLLVYAIIARIIASWFTLGQAGPKNRFIQFLHDVTDPIINVVRFIPHRIGMIDLAPLIAIFALDLLGQLFISLISKLI